MVGSKVKNIILFAVSILCQATLAKAQDNFYGKYISKEISLDTGNYDIVLQLNCDETFSLKSKPYEAIGSWKVTANDNIILFSSLKNCDSISGKVNKIKLNIKEHELIWQNELSVAKRKRITRRTSRELSKSAGEKIESLNYKMKDIHFIKQQDYLCVIESF